MKTSSTWRAHKLGAVDVSSDSTRFATGTRFPENSASVWNMTIGKRRVGPLRYDSRINEIKLSSDDEHVAAIVARPTFSTVLDMAAICLFNVVLSEDSIFPILLLSTRLRHRPIQEMSRRARTKKHPDSLMKAVKQATERTTRNEAPPHESYSGANDRTSYSISRMSHLCKPHHNQDM